MTFWTICPKIFKQEWIIINEDAYERYCAIEDKLEEEEEIRPLRKEAFDGEKMEANIKITTLRIFHWVVIL